VHVFGVTETYFKLVTKKSFTSFFFRSTEVNIIFLMLNLFLSKTSGLGHKPRRMLRAVQRFGKHCNCHHQGGSMLANRFWQPCAGQGSGGGRKAQK
jgi:hypothetical protein